MKTLIMTLSLLFTCASFAGGGSSVGPANPAAVHCTNLGGQLIDYTTPEGQNANCLIEQWALFRAMYEKGLVTQHQYGPGGMPNPAAVNCIDINGTLQYAEQGGFCLVEQWTLFRVFHPIKD